MLNDPPIMALRTRCPLTRFDSHTLGTLSQAAGYAAACEWETNSQFHADAVARGTWSRRQKRIRIAPSITTIILAVIFASL
jgi:hypothetical protein